MGENVYSTTKVVRIGILRRIEIIKWDRIVGSADSTNLKK